jgi:hypothetical protein
LDDLEAAGPWQAVQTGEDIYIKDRKANIIINGLKM